ncbi:hypothetical protein NQZ68_022465 [Dissostichus eleginoides]|nr:hypothetical protein NQZ68_022465 [Dissostichus eleginoides]
MRLSDRFPAAAAPPSSSTSSAPYGIRPGDRFSSTNCVPHDHQQQPAAYHPPRPGLDGTGRSVSFHREDVHKSPLPLRRVHGAPCPLVGTGVTSSILRGKAGVPRLVTARQAGGEMRIVRSP